MVNDNLMKLIEREEGADSRLDLEETIEILSKQLQRGTQQSKVGVYKVYPLSICLTG